MAFALRGGDAGRVIDDLADAGEAAPRDLVSGDDGKALRHIDDRGGGAQSGDLIGIEHFAGDDNHIVGIDSGSRVLPILRGGGQRDGGGAGEQGEADGGVTNGTSPTSFLLSRYCE